MTMIQSRRRRHLIDSGGFQSNDWIFKLKAWDYDASSTCIGSFPKPKNLDDALFAYP